MGKPPRTEDLTDWLDREQDRIDDVVIGEAPIRTGRLHIRNCIVCGKSFMPVPSGRKRPQLACSKTCARVRKRAYQRTWNAAHPDRNRKRKEPT